MFFRQQATALAKKVSKVGVVYVEQKSLKSFWKPPFTNRYQFTSKLQNDVITYTIHGVSLLNQYKLGRGVWVFAMCKLVEKYIKDQGCPDIIHVHNCFNAGFVAKKIFKKYQIPYVITEHASGFLMNEYTTQQLTKCKEVFNSATVVIAVSNKLATSLKRMCDSRVLVVPNIVNTDFFFPSEKPAENEIFQFVSVGNLLPNKGHLFLIEAFSKAFSGKKNVRLVICGDGPERNNLLSIIEQKILNEQVTLTGKLLPDDLLSVYHSSKCLIVPSQHETFGVVIIEALSCGLPVIATRSGGPEDIINKDNGLLINYGNHHELIIAMHTIIEKFSDYQPEKIREDAINKYSENWVTSKLLAVYSGQAN